MNVYVRDVAAGMFATLLAIVPGCLMAGCGADLGPATNLAINATQQSEIARLEALITAMEDGVHCWDLNEDGACDESESGEDGKCSVLDCRGEPGPEGPRGPKGKDGSDGEDGQDGDDTDHDDYDEGRASNNVNGVFPLLRVGRRDALAHLLFVRL